MEYVTSKGVVKPAKIIETEDENMPTCSCRDKCFEKISKQHVLTKFSKVYTSLLLLRFSREQCRFNLYIVINIDEKITSQKPLH